VSRIRQALAVATLAVAHAGCSSSTAPGTKTGGLTITVNAPPNLAVSFTVTGPNGYKTTVTSTDHLTGLAPGSYTINASNIDVGDSVVATVYGCTVTGSPAVVSTGSVAAATVTYAARGGSGALWVVGSFAAGLDTAVGMALGYSATQLRTSGSFRAGVELHLPIDPSGNLGPASASITGLAFDTHGNMWVANVAENTVSEYTASQLTASGTPTPAVKIQLAANSFSNAIAFDSSANLWVANANVSTIVELTAAQLTASGSPTPAVTISEGASATPTALAFDQHGNLWVVNEVSTVVEYTASQLAAGGSPTPAITLTDTAIAGPIGLAFDSSGNLWITAVGSYPYDGHIVEYTAASLTALNPKPAVSFPVLNSNAAYPTGLAFDDSGNLWYADARQNQIAEYAAASLSSGFPSIVTTINNVPLLDAVAIAFSPHAASLPLP